MNPSFVVYIDESGDEGFVFNGDGSGSSRWFVLSAAVIRKANDLQMVSCLKATREVLGKQPKAPLHFVDLKHELRVPYIRRVGDLPIRTVSILIYKCLLLSQKSSRTPNICFTATPLVCCWSGFHGFCRDQRQADEGDGFAEIIFSNLSNMSYNDIRN